jgi:hypothetical protein
MAYDQNGMDLPTEPLPNVPQRAVNDLMASMFDPESEETPFLGCVYGDQGTGKTVAGMRILQMITDVSKKIVYVDTAKNRATFNNHPELKKRLKIMEYENMEQLLILAQSIRVNPSLKHIIGAVMVDEYSSAVKADRKWIVRSRSNQAEKAGKDYKDPHHPSQADYLSSQIRSEEVVQAFLASGVHVMFISHEQVDKKVVTRPDFAPGAANDFQRLIHSVYRSTTKIENGTMSWQLQLQPTGRISVKNRIGGLGVFATAEQVAHAYNLWGALEKESPVTLTPAEAETVTKEDNALLKLLEDNED